MKPLPHDVLPKPLRPLTALTERNSTEEIIGCFEEACTSFYKAWSKRIKEEKKTGTRRKVGRDGKVSANTLLQQNVYRIGIVLLESELIEGVRPAFVSEPNRRKGTPSLEENIFHWILHHILFDKPLTMSMTLRNRLARQLLYAYRHQVPAYLLKGFLYQLADPDDLLSQIQSNARERWYKRLFDNEGTEVNSAGHY